MGFLKQLFCFHYWSYDALRSVNRNEDAPIYETPEYIKFHFCCRKCFRHKTVIVNPKFPFNIEL